MTKKYIHVNQHKIRANKKNGTDEPVITVKEGKSNTYCHEVKIPKALLSMEAMISPYFHAVLGL
jgi:hypothetical protein